VATTEAYAGPERVDLTEEAEQSMSLSWIDSATHRAWLEEQFVAQLRFGSGFAHPGGGAGYLDEHGNLVPNRPVETWITARMLHVYALGHLAGVPGCRPRAAQALRGLAGPLCDARNGGWFTSVDPATGRRDGRKTAYAHAFVVFATASAAVAGIEGARPMLEEALDVLDARFWEPRHGLHLDSRSEDWKDVASYRGINANMHAVEALLAAADVTGESGWRERAAGITATTMGFAEGNGWRIPEHFTADWSPDLDHHRDRPDHPFEPFGATVGHAFEWARLALHVRSASGSDADGLLAAARALFDRAVRDGWAVDGADGFVYTTDWSGQPVVRLRMHWVLCEAISAAAALRTATGDPVYEDWYRLWWDHAAELFIQPDGSWVHELDATNHPSATVWPGRPDLYHSVHAVLLPRLPAAPAAPSAIARGLLR
jgi:mannose/cellobiose epimerase-like protein (N-acyl-D-glucosamine 2-epimerase family)